MRACGAAVHSRVRENSRGMRVRGVEQGVRFFFVIVNFFPFAFRVPRPRLTIEFPFFLDPFLVERLRSVVRAWTCLSSTSQSFAKQQPWQPQQQHPPKHYKRKDYY